MSAELVELEFFGRTATKAHAVDLHPSQPWVAVVDERGCIGVWDTYVNSILATWSVQQLDLALMKQVLGARVTVSEKVSKLGQVLAVKFVDAEVASVIGGEERWTIPGRWLFVACANHAAMIEWRSGQIVHFRTSQLDKQASTAATSIPNMSVLAFGGADGVIRIWDVRKMAVRARLQGVHQKAVTSVAAHGHFLISGGADGSVAMWDLRKDAMITSNTRAHSDKISAVAFSSKAGVSMSADRLVGIWNPNTGKEQGKARLGIKAWQVAGANEGWFVACAKEGAIHKFTMHGGESTPLCDLSTVVPGFKSLKTYSLGTHAASPKFAAGTNHGVAVLSVGASRKANVAIASLTSTLYGVTNKQLWRMKLGGDREILSPVATDSPTEVNVSPDGTHVSVVLSAQKKIILFNGSTGTFASVHESEGVSAVWSSTGSNAALLRANGAVFIASTATGPVTETVTFSPQSPATALYGGPLLGVVSAGHLQFYSWSGEAIGTSLPAPRTIAWDSLHTKIALAYDHHVHVCDVKPSFALKCSVSLQQITGLYWHMNALYASGQRGVHVILPAGGRALTVLLASATAVAPADPEVVGEGLALLSTPVSIPSAAWVPVGVMKGSVVIVDRQASMRNVPLAGTALRCALMYCAEKDSEAKELSEKLRPDIRAIIAQWVATRASEIQTLGGEQKSPDEAIPLSPSDRVLAALAGGRYADAARLLNTLDAKTSLSLFKAVALSTARAGDKMMTYRVLDKIHVVDAQMAENLAAEIGGDIANECATNWNISPL